MRPSDPRVRATLNNINTTLDSITTTTQSYLYAGTQRASPYLHPCLASLSDCLSASCAPCFFARDEHFRSRRHRAGGGGPSSARNRGAGRDGGIGGFDFYDDWEQEELEWGNDELERLLSGGEEEGGEGVGQPRRKKAGMSYGSRLGGGGKRGPGDEPNVVPQSSMFGFLEGLPWKIGGRGSGRFRPGVADLQEGVGRKGGGVGRGGGEDENQGEGVVKSGRGRSGTVESRSTTNSLSSRGDLFPSDDEADAVPLDDEFAMALGRRSTNLSDERMSSKRGGRRSAGSRASVKTESSKRTRSETQRGKRESSASSERVDELDEGTVEGTRSETELKLEEERVRREEEALVEERRVAASKLARERGLADGEAQNDPPAEDQDSKDPSIIESTEIEPQSTNEASQEPPPGSSSPSQPNTPKGDPDAETRPPEEPF